MTRGAGWPMIIRGKGGKGMPRWKSMPPALDVATVPSRTAERNRYFFIRGNRRGTLRRFQFHHIISQNFF